PWPRAPRRAFPSAAPAGSRPTTSLHPKPTSIEDEKDMPMTSTLRLLAVTAVLAVTPLLPASAQSISPDQRKEIEAIIKDYLIKNPEILQEVSTELEKRLAASEAEKHQAAVKEHEQALFN